MCALSSERSSKNIWSLYGRKSPKFQGHVAIIARWVSSQRVITLGGWTLLKLEKIQWCKRFCTIEWDRKYILNIILTGDDKKKCMASNVALGSWNVNFVGESLLYPYCRNESSGTRSERGWMGGTSKCRKGQEWMTLILSNVS